MKTLILNLFIGFVVLAAPFIVAAEDISGEVDLRVQQVDQDNDSSKFNEYKDDENDIYVHEIKLKVTDKDTNRSFDFSGSNLSRSDQDISLRYSLPGKWSIDIDWSEIPHLISNQAKTPYDYIGNGTYRVSEGIVDAIQISDVGSAASWTAADAGPGGAGEDIRINNVLANSVHGIELGTQREVGGVGFTYHMSGKTKLRFDFNVNNKDGSILTGAPIGDRPPRSMTVQLPEPIDYRTEDYRITIEHNMETVQVEASYLYSKFYNDVDSMTWNSLFHDAGYFAGGALDYDEIRIGSSRKYATTGAMALAPDNTYKNLAFNVGVDLPKDSRLNASIAIGEMEQNESLMPYASTDFGVGLPALPRSSTEGKIDTTLVSLAYNISPVENLNTKVFYRMYEMDNKTTQSEFDYYTQDTDSQNYRNERTNLAYGYQKNNYGIDLSYRLMGKLGTVGLGYENETIDRDYRETDETDEDIYKLSYKVRPNRKVSFRVKYLLAERDGGNYDGEVTDQSYHYDTADAGNQAQADNPLMGFGNAPGLRKFDVTDRDRDKLDLQLGLSPTDTISISLSYMNKEDDYDSPIASTITTWDSVAGSYVTAAIDPTQLGLLEDETDSFTVDLNYAPDDRLALFSFYSREDMESKQRGRYLNENNRINTIGAKDWQDTSGQYIWDATIKDETETIGFGANFAAIPRKLDLMTDFSFSKGRVEIGYLAGSYIVEDDVATTANHGEWYSPNDVEFKTKTFKVGANYHMTKKLSFGFDYSYEKYEVSDWQQDGSAAHQDAMSEQYVADHDPETQGTTNDRVGSRLVRLTDYVAPDYKVHMVMVSMNYRF
ncbi:MAG: MtrB/PioB family decaheme-associated outer membrane protein [Proteobacteria bacterium]|nr:MtrB/PioB family decaheme-associated outer membrane protein [Pseudomonadota bacterium]